MKLTGGYGVAFLWKDGNEDVWKGSHLNEDELFEWKLSWDFGMHFSYEGN